MSVARIWATVDVQDKASAKLAKAGKEFDEFADDTAAAMKRAAESSKKAWSDFNKHLEDLAGRIQRTGIGLSAALTLPIVAGAKEALEAAGKMEGLEASLASLVGSSAAARKELADLEGIAARTGTSFDLVVQAGRGMIAGFDGNAKAANGVLERFALLANVMGTSRSDFERMAVNLTQIAGSGRLTGDELREMAAILPNLRVLLKQAFGTNQSEELAKMGISGRAALEGIAKAIDSSGLKANVNTYNAQLQLMQTEFFKLKAAAGQALIPLAKDVIQVLVPAFQRLAEVVRNMTPEQRKFALAVTGVVAALGPLMVLVGSAGSALTGLRSMAELVTKLRESFVKAEGIAGILSRIRLAFVGLTGPVLAVIATVAAVVVAWQKNFLGLRDIVEPALRRIGAMFWDLVMNVQAAAKAVYDAMAKWFAAIWPKIAPYVTAIVYLIQQFVKRFVSNIETGLRFVTDIWNAALAGIQILTGKGFEGVSDSAKASLSRLTVIAAEVMANVTDVIIKGFKLLFGYVRLIPGVGAIYDSVIEKAEGFARGLRATGAAAAYMAGQFQKAADAGRKFPKLPTFGGFGGGGQGGDRSPLDLGAGGGGEGGGGKGKKSAVDKAWQEYQNRIKKFRDLENQLMADRAEAAGARLLDVISLREYGKTYDDLASLLNKATVAKQAEIITFKRDLELKEAARKAIQNQVAEGKRFYESIRLTQLQMKEEIATMGESTNVSRMMFEMRHGQYQRLNFVAKAYLISLAQELDLQEKLKRGAEAMAAWNKAAIDAMADFLGKQRETANSRYEEYVQRLTERLLELRGVSQKMTRETLSDQFAAMVQHIKDPIKRAEELKKIVDQVMGLKSEVDALETKAAVIQSIAQGMESAFMNAFQNIFENGFKTFFNDVVGGIRDMVRNIAMELVKLQIQRGIVGLLNGVGGPGTATMDIFRRASGGRVSRGQAYMVGEIGPEMFVPDRPGRIVPSYQMGGGSSGGQTIINVNVQAATPSAFRRSEAQVVGSAFARAEAQRRRSGRD